MSFRNVATNDGNPWRVEPEEGAKVLADQGKDGLPSQDLAMETAMKEMVGPNGKPTARLLVQLEDAPKEVEAADKNHDHLIAADELKTLSAAAQWALKLGNSLTFQDFDADEELRIGRALGTLTITKADVKATQDIMEAIWLSRTCPEGRYAPRSDRE